MVLGGLNVAVAPNSILPELARELDAFAPVSLQTPRLVAASLSRKRAGHFLVKTHNATQSTPEETLGVETPASKLQASVASTG